MTRIRFQSRTFLPVFILLATLLAPFARLQAQVGSANLSGLVEDTTGAVVPGATTTLHNVHSGADRTQKSNSSGAFTFSAVPSGDYSITITRDGFRTYTQKGIHLNPGDNNALASIKLEVGEVNQVVTVEQTTAGLPLDNGQLSSTISSNDIEKLSIVGRDATELQKILPGFAIRNLGSTNTAPDFTQVTVGQPTPYASNGAPVAGITLKLDGANLTDAGNFGANLQNINDSFVSEVQVQTSNFGSDQSNGPVVITGVTKSGTSVFHGNVYTYARVSALNANDWLAKYNGLSRPDDRFIYPGAIITGPVPGSKKLFFTAGAEYDAQRNVYAYGSSGSAIIHALVPTAAMRKGDFSQTSLAAFLGPELNNGNYGTFNTVPIASDQGTYVGNTGNIAPWLDPGAMAIVNGTLPLPTRQQTGTDGYNYDAQDLVNNNVSQFVGRLDYTITPRNTFFARYSFEKGKQGQPLVPYYAPVSVMGEVNTPGYGVNNDTWVHSGAANYVTVFTPTLTNELYATLTSFLQSFDPREVSALQKTAIGTPYNGAFDNHDTQYPQLGTYTTYGGLPLGLWPDVSLNPLELKKFQPNVGDNLTKVWGKHTVKLGIFSQRTTNNQTATNPSTNGIIQNYYFGPAWNQFAGYNGTYPDGSPAYDTTGTHFNSGNALANFFEGQIQDWHQQNFNPYTNLYFWNTDFYLQDTWRVVSNLVVNYGARVTHLGAWNDAHGVGASVWIPSLYNTTQNPTTNPLPGFTWHGLNPSIPNSGTGNPPLYFEPRVGFALDLFKNGKTVVRGGVGVYRFHDAVTDVTSMFAQSENVRYTDLQGFGGNELKGISSLHLNPNTYGNAGGTETSIPLATVYGLDPSDNKEPVTNNYSISFAQQLPGNWILQASYVGNNSNSLMDNGTTQTVVLDNLNAIPVGYLFTPTAAAAINAQSPGACNATGCTPVQAGALDNIYNYPGDKSIQNARPYPRYSQIIVPHHNTYANYNGLQIEAIKQIGHLSFNANYTYSKALGILGSAADFNWTAGIDPFHLDNNYGPMNFDRTQILNLSYAYQMGKFTTDRLLGGFINGWLISGITNVSSGPNMQTGVSPSPGYYVQGNINQGANGYAVSNTTILGTPDVNLQPLLKCNPKSGLGKNQFLNGSCFGLPATGTNGQYIEPYAHGPAFFNSDLTVEKSFSLGGDRALRFRYAAFNFVNHALNSFGTGYASQTTLQLSDTSVNGTPGSATYDPSTGFGSAPLKLGRRISGISLRYTF
jgi:hypothetical protein